MRFGAVALVALSSLLAAHPFAEAFGNSGGGAGAFGGSRKGAAAVRSNAGKRPSNRVGLPPPHSYQRSFAGGSSSSSFALRSSSGGGDDNGEEKGKNDDNDEAYDWRSGPAAGRQDSGAGGSEDGGGGIDKKRKRDQLRDFFSAPATPGSEPVKPFDAQGNEIEELPPPPPARTVRPKFDALFGTDGRMPGLDDIIGGARGEITGAQSDDEAVALGSSSASMDDDDDDDDFDEHHPDDTAVADASFASFMEGMAARIAEQRAADPDSVPDNAERFLEGVVGEMRQAKLDELREVRLGRDMAAYEARRREEMEDRVRDLGLEGGRGDSVVKEVLGEAEGEAAERELLEGKVEDFRTYEKRRMQEAEEEGALAAKAAAKLSEAQAPGGGGQQPSPVAEAEDPDEQALLLMEDLLARRTAEEEEWERKLADAALTGTGDDDYVIPEWDTDNLEDGIAELKAAIMAKQDAAARGERQARGGEDLVRPETMKEWQMYRSISSKIISDSSAAQKSSSSATTTDVDGGGSNPSAAAASAASKRDEYESDVSDKLRGFREFQAKEDEMRRASGLTQGSRMPFAWSDRGEGAPPTPSSKAEAATAAAAYAAAGGRKKDKNKGPPAFAQDPDRVRLEYDRTALRVLSDLANSPTCDAARSAKLRLEIAELEVDVAELEEKIRTKPVRSEADLQTEDNDDAAAALPVDVSDIFGGGRSVFGDDDDDKKGASSSAVEPLPPPPPAPETAFFSDSFAEEEGSNAAFDDEEEESSPTAPAAPDTPFFRDDEVEENANVVDGKMESLGSIEEQRLRSMARQRGVRSAAGEEKLRREWEEFQQFEAGRREGAGLSGGDLVEDPNLIVGYDMSEMVTGDGDVDADKILESIGERPSKKKRKMESSGDATGAAAASSSSSAVGSTPAEEGSYEQYLQYERERMEAERIKSLEEQVQGQGQGQASSASDASTTDDKDDEKDDVIVYQKRATQWDKTSTTDQLYRSLGAGGSGRDGANRAEFEEYLRKEEEMRRAVEGESVDVLAQQASSTAGGAGEQQELESVEAMEDYADDVLEELGPRPAKADRRRAPTLGGDDDYDEEDDDDMDANDFVADAGDGEYSGTLPSTGTDQLPDWVRREEEERRREEFITDDDADARVGSSGDEDYATSASSDGNGDDGNDDENKYLDEVDYETKQRQAAEFERRTSGGDKPQEVSLGDVFGRDYFGPDDEPDDDYSLTKGRGDAGSSFSSFERRMKDLMDYTELSVPELNSLMDYKDEASGGAGASKYMKKVMKPYREFGAVFRLEGLLADVTGLNREAWKRTAEKHGYDMPELELVKVAAAHRAEFAVQRVFYWTDDFMEGREIAKTQREMIAEVFGEWMEEQGLEYKSEKKKGKAKEPGSFDLDLGLGDDDASGEASAPASVVEAPPVASDEQFATDDTAPFVTETSTATTAIRSKSVAPSEAEFMSMQHGAWVAAATRFNLQSPTEKDVESATFLSPEDTVTKLFQWTEDEAMAEQIVLAYRSGLKEATDRWAAQHNPEDLSSIKAVKKEEAVSPDEAAENGEQGASSGGLSEDDMLEMQLFSWTAAAEANGCAAPSLEEVQMATWVSPDEAVRKVFKWTGDDDGDGATASQLTTAYAAAMKQISEVYIKKKNLRVQKAEDATSVSTGQDAAAPAAPTEEDILKFKIDVWTEVARRNSFDPPNVDEVQMSTFGTPDEAAIRVFKWTDDIERSLEIAGTHREVMEELSKEFLQKFGQAQPGSQVAAAGGTDGDDDVSLPLFELNFGIVEWLETLREVELPCALLSHLDRREVDVILDQTGLADFFPPERRVTVSNSYFGEMNELLGAALRLERRPDHCAVFDVTPGSAVAAHENGMRSVAVIGVYANYDLLAADMTVKYFDQFRAQNLRGLFSDVKLDEPQEELQIGTPEARPRPLQTRFFEEGDRS